MIKHLLTIIKNEYRQNIGIWLELCIVSVLLWYIVDDSYCLLRKYYQPLGFNIEHTYGVKINYLSNKSSDFDPNISIEEKTEQLKTILTRIRNCSFVKEAAISYNAYPYSPSQSSSALYKDTTPSKRYTIIRYVSPEFFRVFQYKATNGSTETLVKAIEKNELVLSENISKKIFGKKNAIGERIGVGSFQEEDKKNIGAISQNVRYAENSSNNRFAAVLLNNEYLQELSGELSLALDFSIRIKDGEDFDIINRFKKEMNEQIRIGNYYLNEIHPISRDRENFLEDTWNDYRIKAVIIFFLLINILLGVSGIFWFRTQARQSEIGLRISVGDTPKKIHGKYIFEGLILLFLAIVPSIPIMYLLGIKEILTVFPISFGFSRLLIGFTISFVLLALTIILGIYLPARKYIHIPPAEALRDE